MSDPRTPQVPMVDENGKPFYPLTQYNQIVMPDGSRWDGKGGGAQIDDTSASTEKVYSSQKVEAIASQLSQQKANKAGWTAGKNVVTDAEGNITTEDKPTALKNPNQLTINGQSYDGSEPVEMTVSGLPSGGTAGQVLSKKSDANQDAEWADPSGGGMEMKLLWQNASPITSRFYAQTISLDLSEYALVYIIFSHFHNASTGFFPTMFTVGFDYGEVGFVDTDDGSSIKRGINVTESGVIVGVGKFYNSNGWQTSSDGVFVNPYQIYGVKGAIL